jgi:AcrR family transcriptional regulator
MPRKPATLRREEIVQAALTLIAQQGPGTLTTGAIAEAVGVSQATVFKHFPTKGAILAACVDWIGGQVEPAVDRALAGAGSAEARLRATLQAVCGVCDHVPAMPTTFFSRELHAEYPTLLETIRDGRRRFAAAIARLLEEGAAAGEFAPAINVNAGAYLVIGLVHTLLLRRHQGNEQIDLAEEASTMLDLLLSGLRPR